MAKLTDLRVKNAKPSAKRYELSDNGGAVRLIVQPSGHKSYGVRTRLHGKPIKVTLGDATTLSLHDARVLAATAINDARKGIDPRAAKNAAKAQRQIAEENTLAAIGELYLTSPKKLKLRTIKQVRDVLERLVYPKLGTRPVADIKRSEYTRLLDHIERTRGPRMADVALSAMWGVAKFYADRDDDYTVPFVATMRRTSASETARDRILDDDEIRKLWAATRSDRPKVRAGNRFVRFLLLTGARRDEAAAMQWKEISGNVWTLPSRRNKAKVDLIRTLPAAAMALLPERGADDEYAFHHVPDRPFASFARLKRRIQADVGFVREWRLHDLRRTARSLLSRAGVNADVGEMILGHKLQGVRGTYDRHSYQSEKAHALEALAHQIELITDPPKGNVRQLKQA